MIRINLLPVRVSRRAEAVKTELIIAGLVCGALVLMMLIAHVAISARVNNVRAENNALKTEIEQKQQILNKVRELEKVAQEVQQKLSVIKQLKARKTGPVHMLDQLAIAAPEKLQILSLQEKKGKVDIEGLAVNNEIISQFLSNLEQSEYFENVYLNSIEQEDERGVKLKSFSISAKLVMPGLEELAPAAAPAKDGKAPAAGGGK
jgi:type IV pilus assembly protein PilN